ncbi:helix-turn-helix transcriptional regulator [Lunatibacter salilacus]|uniref:helix-turn-helix transcriptional regulator n=1 Tax=Lunatibacter salilacus TaxID=2483804 RepID=UPI001F43F7DC|nr:helix-turn-helix transcriptional regulator [Lunatibacter salilacus]
MCELVRDGKNYKEIGEKLFISQRTVNKHIQNIFKKTNSKNKVELLNTISGR